jgi:hypothetical protein
MKLGFFVILIFAIAGLTGCGHEAGPMDEATSVVPAPASASLFGGMTVSAQAVAHKAQQAEGGGNSNAPDAPTPHAQMIIRSAEMQIVAKDPATTLRDISAQVEARGGFVADSKQWQEGDQTHGTLTLRVPAAQLTASVAQIRKAALRTVEENITGQDVSQEYTDLTAQLTNLEATEVQLRELLATVRQKTQRAADVLDVFNKLSDVRGQIDQTKGRLLEMSQQVDMATITLTISPNAVAAPPPPAAAWHPTGVAADALQTLGSTLKWLCDVLIWVCLYIAPLAALIGLPAFYIRRSWRATKRTD